MASPGLNFLRILANSISIREDSSDLDLELRRSEMKLLRPRAWADMVYAGGRGFVMCTDDEVVCLFRAVGLRRPAVIDAALTSLHSSP